MLAEGFNHHCPASRPIKDHPMNLQVLVFLESKCELGEPGAALATAAANGSAFKRTEREFGKDGNAHDDEKLEAEIGGAEG